MFVRDTVARMRGHRMARGAALVLAGLAIAADVRADLVVNGSFSAGLTSWMAPGAPAVQYQVGPFSHDGSQAVRVSARAGIDEAPRQDITSRLAATAPGATWTARCAVMPTEDLSARFMLLVTDAAGTRQEILAESLATAGSWSFLEGTTQLTWQPPLTRAILFVRSDKVSETVYPDIVVDDFLLEVDQDADGLTDPEEAAAGTRADSPDGDGDGMDDAFEARGGLDPLAPDADADRDGDGATNREEWAARTRPDDPASRPGTPSSLAMGPSARCVLRWLAHLPSQDDARLVVGQHLSYPAPPNDEYGAYIDALVTATGKHPALLCLQYDDGSNPVQVSAVNPYALAWWQAGGLVQIKWNPHNPFTGGSYQDRTFTTFQEALTTGTPANQHLTMQLDQVADGLQELRDAGVVVLWRLCSEMNGNWFWWGRRDRAGYVAFWRYVHDWLVTRRGLDNLIWVYEADSGVHQGVAIDYYYPGDDVVDVLGHNLYSDTWSLPFDSEKLLAPHGKVFAIPQAGPDDVRDGSFDDLTYLEGAPQGTGGARHRMPRLSYLAAWNSFTTWDPVLMRSVYMSLALVDNVGASALLDDPWIVTRDEISFAGLVPGPAGLLLVTKPGGALRFAWGDAPGATDHVVLSDPAAGGPFATIAATAVSGGPGVTLPMPPEALVFYLVAGRNDCGVSD